MEIIYRGAESIIYLDTFDGQKVLVKERVRKGYRLAKIDEKLRKERTRKEVKLLTDARKLGVPTPTVIHADFQHYKIIMEKIDGIRVKDFLNKENDAKIRKVCFEIGRLIGKLRGH